MESGDVVSFVNTAFANMLRMTKEEVMRINWKTYTHPDDFDKDNSLYQQMMRGDIDQYELIKRYIRPDGEVVRASLSCDSESWTVF